MSSNKTEKLGALCKVLAGGTPSRSKKTYWNGGIPWVKISDMLQGHIHFTDESITQEGLDNSAARLLPKGTLLLSIFATIGRTAILEIEAATNQAVVGLIPKRSDEIDVGYLRRHLEAQVSSLVQQGRGGAQSNINGAILKNLDIPLPPLDEQKRIAAVLDKADALRRQRQESLQLTEKLLQSVFIDMFGTELEPLCPRARLSEHLDFITSGGRGWSKYYAGEGDKFIRSLDVRMNEISDAEMVRVKAPKNAEADRTRIREGDVLLTITGSLIGRAAPVTARHAGDYISQHVAILRTQGFMPEFLAWAISTEEGQRQIQRHQTGQTKPGLNFEQIGRLMIPRPTESAERKFSELIQRHHSILAEQRAAVEQTESLFSSLQQRAFRDKLNLSRLPSASGSAVPRTSQPLFASF
ncbi:MAG TPA: hypothetical protein DCZ95_05330 [Verrucomicrobia bacterium]|nr:MAG: hypothetical protein A2X46_10370 [Lentisphaerae bacterium GWF2_57_35]HBA83500.1 hypothetical protein [Verrucomicrobiota bacterium]